MSNIIKKIVFTGPESSGKTTMSKLTADLFNEPWVREYARNYLEKRNGKYNLNDLTEIAKGQIEEENITIPYVNRLLICDTDLMIIKIWSEHKYKTCSEYILNEIQNRNYDLYFLCKNDFPWQNDPLRENPTLGNYFFERIENDLRRYNKNYIIIEGSIEDRLSRVKKEIKNLQD